MDLQHPHGVGPSGPGWFQWQRARRTAPGPIWGRWWGHLHPEEREWLNNHLHPQAPLPGHWQLPPCGRLWLCQVSQQLWMSCLRGWQVLLPLRVSGWLGHAVQSPATLGSRLLGAVGCQHVGGGTGLGSGLGKLHQALPAMGTWGHGLILWSANPL